MQPNENFTRIEPTLDGRPFLGDMNTVNSLVEHFVRAVLRTMDDFHAGKIERQAGIDAVEALCKEYGTIFAGNDERYQPAQWLGSRLAGRIMASVPGSKWGESVDNAVAEYFRWLSKQIIKVHTEMHKGMADEEAGPVVQCGMKDAVAFLLGVR